MTRALMRSFPLLGGAFRIEPDASSGSYLSGRRVDSAQRRIAAAISVRHWPTSGWQVDAEFPKFLSGLDLPKEVSREHDLGDSIMTAAVLAPLAGHLIRLTDLGRLRLQESERVAALRNRTDPFSASSEGRHANHPAVGQPAAQRQSDLRQPPPGDVFCHSGIESPRGLSSRIPPA